jgi:hypothetical protein
MLPVPELALTAVAFVLIGFPEAPIPPEPAVRLMDVVVIWLVLLPLAIEPLLPTTRITDDAPLTVSAEPTVPRTTEPLVADIVRLY